MVIYRFASFVRVCTFSSCIWIKTSVKAVYAAVLMSYRSLLLFFETFANDKRRDDDHAFHLLSVSGKNLSR